MPRAWRALLLAGLLLWPQSPRENERSEFRFLRLEYKDAAYSRRGFGRGWWRQDWPEAELHFNQGIRRLTRVHTGEGHHLPLTDDRIFDFPWIYATQVGYWDLSDEETTRLRHYLERGGFLVVDDFFGPNEYELFRHTMARVLPDQPIVTLDESEPIWQVLYDIRQRFFIAGLRHLGIGRGFGRQTPAGEPQWQAIRDAKGHIVVAVNFNVDIGDAWEHADLAEYPEPMTGLAYRLGINYIVYAMTH